MLKRYNVRGEGGCMLVIRDGDAGTTVAGCVGVEAGAYTRPLLSST
jgi:hypothetical protein